MNNPHKGIALVALLVAMAASVHGMNQAPDTWSVDRLKQIYLTCDHLISDHVHLRPASPPHPNPLPRVQGRGSKYSLPLPLAGEGWGEGELVAEPCRWSGGQEAP